MTDKLAPNPASSPAVPGDPRNAEAIYLDFNASTPVDPAALEAMWPYLSRHFGNASSGHVFGRAMAAGLASARRQVAGLLGVSPEWVVFTSGGTESNNFALKGAAARAGAMGRHIITSAIEHKSVLLACRHLERNGFELTVVGVDGTGTVDPVEVRRAVRPGTFLISIMHASNEVGTIQPIADIAAIAREAGALLHTDAAQTCGKIGTRMGDLGADLLTIAGHKVYGPQGIGALAVREGVELEPLHHGAGHERGLRSGTEPVAAIVGLGAACERAAAALDERATVRRRDRLFEGLTAELGKNVRLNGHPTRRLPNTLNVGFRGRDANALLASMPRLCASPGAACHSGKTTPSATLSAMGVPGDYASGSIRFSLGRTTTDAQVEEAIQIIVQTYRRTAI